ncbi:MAG: hypothetical protein FWH43_03610 [Endomicrobia bacterium]|nr:hypothetical protein [Endomicrobiia bacterium]
MKKIMKKLIPLSLVFLLTANSYAAVGGAAFLKRGVGARALGMGGAFTSLSNDTSAVYWNPAGLGQVQDYSVTVMGSTGGSDEWPGLEDMTPSHNFVAVSVPMSKFTDSLGASVFALGLINSTMDNITHSDSLGNEIGSFSDSQNAVYLSWGMPVWESSTNLYVGVSIKYIMEKMDGIDGGSASGYDLDAGVIYNVFETLNFGLFIGKGAAMKWDGGETDNAALTSKFGVSNNFKLIDNLVLLGSADLIQRQKEPLSGNIGFELGYINIYDSDVFGLSGLFLRGGVESIALENRYGVRDEINKNITYTAGFGIDMTIFGKYLQLDYALGLGNQFDRQSKISLNLYF